jgi:peptide/nickel transport system permease protein
MTSSASAHTQITFNRARRRLVHLGRRLAKRPAVAVSLLVLVGLALAILFPGLFTSADPYALNPVERLQPPSASHWFGTDENGRDIFGRIIYGARITVGLTLFAICLSLVIGVVIGSIAWLAGRGVDALLMRVTDVFLAFPQLILAMAIVAALGPGMIHAMIGISLAWWSQYARIVRSQIAVVKEREYVAAAVSLGQRPLLIVLRHMLPNAMTPVLVKASLDLGLIMLNLAGLSFIGLGASPPTPEWGAMIAGGRNLLLEYPWVTTFPGLAIFTTVMAFNFVADWLRDITDPRSS